MKTITDIADFNLNLFPKAASVHNLRRFFLLFAAAETLFCDLFGVCGYPNPS
jgi:hypothetical protein